VRKILFFLISMFLILIPVGCDKNSKEVYTEADVQIYAFEEETMQLVNYGYQFRSEDTKGRINELFGMLKLSGGEYTGILDDTMYVISWSLSEEGILQVTFGEKYVDMSVQKEVMSRGAIVKTLCQLAEISGVEFYLLLDDSVDSVKEPLSVKGAEVGIMKDSEFLEEIGMMNETSELVLFYANASGDRLIAQTVQVDSNDNYTIEQQIVESLINGDGIGEYRRTVPTGTKINHIVTRNWVCYVDLSSDFMNYVEGVSYDATIYSIVNSLTMLDIQSVVFTINGETLDLYGTMEFSAFFQYNNEIVETVE